MADVVFPLGLEFDLRLFACKANHERLDPCADSAVLGKLPWQADRELVFARAPHTVYLDGYPPFGRCSGYTDSECSDTIGFANDDIFYLEVCLLSQVCEQRFGLAFCAIQPNPYLHHEVKCP